ncbi:MAG: hypothetical protein K2G34_13065, partial [Bacteroides sp.]|nr:hypothetical protein [Bacteroides sp.]
IHDLKVFSECKDSSNRKQYKICLLIFNVKSRFFTALALSNTTPESRPEACLLRIFSVLSPSKGTFARRKYGAGTEKKRFGYNADRGLTSQ